MDGEGMNAALQFAGERLIDEPVPLQPGHAFEDFRHYIDAKMGLPARPMPGMAFMLVRFVDHREALRGESLGQLFCDAIGGSHGNGLMDAGGDGQCVVAAWRPAQMLSSLEWLSAKSA